MRCIPNNLYHPTNVFWEGKQRDYATPMSVPQLANGRIEPIPLLGKEFEIDQRFSLGTGRIDQFQISSHLLAMFVGDILKRVAYQMHHTELDTRLRIERLNGFR
jgi:hypothetical protein